MKNSKTELSVLLLSTVCLLTGAYGQFTPSQDASTFNHHGGQNYGTAQTVVVESIGPPPGIANSYIQFDLSSIPSSYTGTNVTKASLKLFVQSMVSPGSFNVDLVNGSWTELKIAYNNALALGATVASNIPLTTANINDYVIVDVTSAVQDWLNGSQANDGIALVANSGLDVSFDSKENTTTSHPAELDIVFAGAVTSVNTPNGSGLMGGGTGNVSLSLTNACSINQILSYNGAEWVCSNISGTGGGTVTSVGSGNGLTGGPITSIGVLAIDPTVVPQLGAANNNFTGSLSASTFNAANGFNLGGLIFDSGSPLSNNAFLGFAGNGTNPGTGNTASGWQALAADTTGGSNVASGYLSLNSNTSGSFNTALGVFAGQTGDASPMTTSNNTFLGAGSEATNGGINNATAIGSNSVVGANNALVLGSIAGLNNATASTRVGIGTTAPAATLDVEAPSGSAPSVNFFGTSPTPGTFTVTGNATIMGSGNALFFPDGSKQTTAYTGGGSGGGTVTSVGAPAGGGLLASPSNPITASGNLTIDPSVVPLLATGNTFAGAITAPSFVGSGLGFTGSGAELTNVNAATLGGFSPSTFATLGANAFTGNQTVTGSLFASGNVGIGTIKPQATLDVNGSINLPNTSSSTVGLLSLGGQPFLHNYGVGNTFVGASSGNTTLTGSAIENTAVGSSALENLTTGASNSAFGDGALVNNQTGADNAALGVQTLAGLIGGNNNIAIGYQAGGNLSAAESNNITAVRLKFREVILTS